MNWCFCTSPFYQAQNNSFFITFMQTGLPALSTSLCMFTNLNFVHILVSNVTCILNNVVFVSIKNVQHDVMTELCHSFSVDDTCTIRYVHE